MRTLSVKREHEYRASSAYGARYALRLSEPRISMSNDFSAVRAQDFDLGGGYRVSRTQIVTAMHYGVSTQCGGGWAQNINLAPDLCK